MNEKVTDNQCIVCSGWLIERSEIPHQTIVMAAKRNLIGSGFHNMPTDSDRIITGYHCENCGLEYHKLPK